MMGRLVLAAAAAASLGGVSIAQDLDFGSWCSDVARFPADRCLEQRPEDKQAYDLYLSRINLFMNEKMKKDESRRLVRERVNRMGDVTHDQIRDLDR